MADNPAISQILQFGPETVAGTQVAATKKMQSIMVTPKAGLASQTGVPQGAKLPVSFALTEEWADWSGNLATPSYGEMTYLYASALGNASPVALGTAGGQTWTFSSNAYAPDVRKTFTIEHGSSADARYGTYGIVTALGLKITRKAITGTVSFQSQLINEGFTLTSLTQTAAVRTYTTTGVPTGGTFTLTVTGTGFAPITTAPIAYNATAAAVAAAINLAAGFSICIATGGPLPTAVVVTFGGAQGDVVATHADSLTGGASPAVSIATTTAGVNVYPEFPMYPLQSQLTDIYIDSSAAALGTTVMARVFELDVNWANLVAPFFPIRSTTTSFGGQAETEQQNPIVLTVQADSAGRAYLTNNFRKGVAMFIRSQTGGALLDGTNSFMHQLDVCMMITNAVDWQVAENLYTIRYTGRMFLDNAWGKGANVVLQNKLAAL